MKQESFDKLPDDFEDLSKYAPTLAHLRAIGAADGQQGFVVPDQYFDESAALIRLLLVFADTARQDGFVVPDDYFENLSEEIRTLIRFAAYSRRDGYELPENYFEQLPAFLASRLSFEHGQEEGFTIPDKYFDELSDLIRAQILFGTNKTDEGFVTPDAYFDSVSSDVHTHLALDNLKQDNGFEIPEGYFDQLPGSLQSRIALENMQEGSDADIPAGYFDSLSSRIRSRIAAENESAAPAAETIEETTEEKGRIVVFAEYISRNRRYFAAAAAIALLISIGIIISRQSVKDDNGKPFIGKNDQRKPIQNNLQPLTPVQKLQPQQQPQVQPDNIAQNNQPDHTPNPVDTTVQKDTLSNLANNNTPVPDTNIPVVADAQSEFTQSLADASFRQDVLDYLSEDSDDLSLAIEQLKAQKGGRP